MKQSKKMSSFLKAINKYAQEQSEAIRLEAEEFKKQEIEKATKEGIEDAYALIQKEVSTKKAQITSDIAKREQESRKQLFIKRNEIVKRVFDDAKEKLIEYTNTDEYLHYLKDSANKIKESFDGAACVVYIKVSDADKEGLIKEIIPQCTVKTDDSIIIGGLKGYCQSRSVIADDTLDSKLEDQYEWFYENCDLKVV